MRCWWCGTEPTEIHDLVVMEQANPIGQVAHWPPGDHEHTELPPTPAQLEHAGHKALARILHDV